MTTTTKPKPWNALRRRYGDTVSILRALDVDEDVRVIVFGDGSNGSYDFGIERKGLVEKHSDCGYGSADIALRDGLIAYYGLPPEDGTFMKTFAPRREPAVTPSSEKPATGWIPVSERLPTEARDQIICLAYAPESSDGDKSVPGAFAASYDDGEWTSRMDTGCWEPGEVTHWMPLPEAPCETCNDDPAVCAAVPGLRHCEAATRSQSSAVAASSRTSGRTIAPLEDGDMHSTPATYEPASPSSSIAATEVLTKITRAKRTVDALCQGRIKWTMHVPVQVDDPDLVIMEALDAAEEAIGIASARPGRPVAQDAHAPPTAAPSAVTRGEAQDHAYSYDCDGDSAAVQIYQSGAIKIKVGGSVHVRMPHEWHALAVASQRSSTTASEPQGTFACSVCGLDTPHWHDVDAVNRERVERHAFEEAYTQLARAFPDIRVSGWGHGFQRRQETDAPDPAANPSIIPGWYTRWPTDAFAPLKGEYKNPVIHALWRLWLRAAETRTPQSATPRGGK